jgi:hypothetical protein
MASESTQSQDLHCNSHTCLPDAFLVTKAVLASTTRWINARFLSAFGKVFATVRKRFIFCVDIAEDGLSLMERDGESVENPQLEA